MTTEQGLLITIVGWIIWMTVILRYILRVEQLKREAAKLKQQVEDLTTALEVFEDSPTDAAIIHALNTGDLRIRKYETYYDNPQKHLHISMDGIHVTSPDIRQGFAAIKTAQHAQRLASGEVG